MRVGFAGTPEFAVAALESVLAAGFDVPIVLTKPDRPRGRGLKTLSSPVKMLCEEKCLCLAQPATLRNGAFAPEMAQTPIDVLVVAAYGLILPQAVLDWPTVGSLNIHASLLPRWRGAAPIQRAILAGDGETGITIMHMGPGLDSGPVVSQVALAIGASDDCGILRDRLAAIGAQAIVAALSAIERTRTIAAVPQDDAAVTYAAKITHADSEIDWRQDAPGIDRRIRAMSPAPGAQTTLGQTVLKIWRARPVEGVSGEPGRVICAGPEGFVVACGEGALDISVLQRAGGRRLPVAAFLAGYAVSEQSLLGASFPENAAPPGAA